MTRIAEKLRQPRFGYMHLREFVMPLLAATIVGFLVWAYLDRRLRNTLVLSYASLTDHHSAYHLRHERETETPRLSRQWASELVERDAAISSIVTMSVSK
jgi:hypothetical protein